MEIRVLEYFLAVAREQTISGAAEALHMTQPPLSKQMMELERELGKQLFIRGKRRITLTREGMLLRKRAEEILSLVEKTKAEVSTSDESISGDIYIGGGETEGMRLIVQTVRRVQEQYPNIRFHFSSGDGYDVTERLDRGLIDFGTLIEPIDMSKYDYLRLPRPDTWGVLMRKEHPLASLKCIRPEDLQDVPMITSRQMEQEDGLSGWLGHGAGGGHREPGKHPGPGGGGGRGLPSDPGQIGGSFRRTESLLSSFGTKAGILDVSGLEKVPGVYQCGGGFYS